MTVGVQLWIILMLFMHVSGMAAYWSNIRLGRVDLSVHLPRAID